jgi:hypothetical protein
LYFIDIWNVKAQLGRGVQRGAERRSAPLGSPSGTASAIIAPSIRFALVDGDDD